ncbi:hypothetical protein GGR51DRAFT_508777 [Nemania sp. FL0031]|nr:hypothetical protein GGR51DRAFT_508777 [Nemania sp. FL0031]
MPNLGPLTTAYTAISSIACQSIHLATDTDGFWLERENELIGCFPSNFTLVDGYYYSPGICQEGYTYACTAAVGGLGTTAATCCPSGFSCQATRLENDNAACQSVLRSATSYIGDIIAYPNGVSTKIGTTTTLIGAGELVYAAGVLVRRAATDAEWLISSTNVGVTTTKMETIATGTETMPGISKSTQFTANMSTFQGQISSSHLSPSGPGGHGSNTEVPTGGSASHIGLSTGSIAAIAVGTVLGALLFLAVIAAIYFKRKRRERASAPLQMSLEVANTEGKLGQQESIPELEEQRGVHEMDARREPAELY